MNLIEAPNKTAQTAEQCFDLTHNVQGGTIRMPNPSHDEAIYRELYELIKKKRGFVRRLQETFMKVNQIITVSRVVTKYHTLTQASESTK